ncbi:hypothetical protein KIW84_014134 [Lathyrus oleraceus]|uniref:DUF7745 domain-containing protein n=1 Tax=Pisum sativum TaxID=3888 RepID=A0A9D5GYX8_PEA|nr:hypothetical protein KIW84_014134 [Pisum sativum]
MKELRSLTSYVLDLLEFKARHGKLLSILATQVDEGLMSVLVQFYDPLYRCFTFPDFQLLHTLEEYAYIVGIPILDQVSFNGLERVPTSQEIVDLLHIDESLVGAHMTTKGGIQGLPSEFLIAQATLYGKAMSEDAFEAIFVLLIYGLVLFPNIDKFVDMTVMRIFSTLNLHLPQTVAFKENKGYLRWSVRLMSITNDDIFWYNRVYHGVQIIDSCGEFSNVPLLGTCGGINYNPILARRHLGFPLKDKPNNILLEGVFFQKGKDPEGLKGRMVRAWRKIHRKGRKELGLKNCIALEPYTSWVTRRASEYLMPYYDPRPTVASAKNNRRAKNKNRQSRHRALFIQKEGRETLRVNLEKAWSRDQRERDRESVTQGEGISTPHVRRTRRGPRSKRKKRLLKQTSHTHTEDNTGGGKEERLARTSRPMPTYLVWNENQSCRSSAHARQTGHTQTQANMEPERQSLDLHRLLNQTNTLRIRTANRWSYIHILTHKKKQTTRNKLLRSRELEPSNCPTNTHKRKEKCPERPRTVSCLRTSSEGRLNKNSWGWIAHPLGSSNCLNQGLFLLGDKIKQSQTSPLKEDFRQVPGQVTGQRSPKRNAFINSVAKRDWLMLAGNKNSNEARQDTDLRRAGSCSSSRTTTNFQKIVMNFFQPKRAMMNPRASKPLMPKQMKIDDVEVEWNGCLSSVMLQMQELTKCHG